MSLDMQHEVIPDGGGCKSGGSERERREVVVIKVFVREPLEPAIVIPLTVA
jgi:hypothetical protein